jgi:hypothetical protein
VQVGGAAAILTPPEPSPIEGEGDAGVGFGHKSLLCKHLKMWIKLSPEGESTEQWAAARELMSTR